MTRTSNVRSIVYMGKNVASVSTDGSFHRNTHVLQSSAPVANKFASESNSIRRTSLECASFRQYGFAFARTARISYMPTWPVSEPSAIR